MGMVGIDRTLYQLKSMFLNHGHTVSSYLQWVGHQAASRFRLLSKVQPAIFHGLQMRMCVTELEKVNILNGYIY
jgi:hypothetical protein